MTDILVPEFVKGLFVFLRISAMLTTAPLYSNRSIPLKTKLMLSLIITYIVVMTVDDYNFDQTDSMIAIALVGVKEVFIGLIMGFALNFIFYGLSFAGMLIGRNVGWFMAQMFDPNSESNTNVVGILLTMLGMFIFIIIDGHHYVIRAVAFSFTLIPIGHHPINGTVIELLIKYSAGIFILAIKIASPIIVAFFLIHLAAGIISRVSPQFQVFFVMLPLKLVLGIILLTSVLPIYIYVIRNLLMDYENKLFDLVKAMSI